MTPIIFIIIAMIALTTSHLCLLRTYKQLKQKIENAEARYLDLAALALRRERNGQEE